MTVQRHTGSGRVALLPTVPPNYTQAASSGFGGWLIIPGDDAGVGNAELPGLVYCPGYGATANAAANNLGDEFICDLLHAVVFQLRRPMYVFNNGEGAWGNQASTDYVEAHLPTCVGTDLGNDPDNLIMIGGSAGAATVTSYAKANPGKLAVMVALAPVSDIDDIHANNRGGGR